MKCEETVCKIELPILKQGDCGDAVRSLQLLLIGNGYSCGYKEEDGAFGKNTKNSLRAFQRDRYLTPTGIADAESWQKLLSSSGYEEVISQCRI